MCAHCMIHAGLVFIATASLPLAVFQFGTHYLIDTCKCTNVFGKTDRAFVIDQLLHIGIMALIAVVFATTH